MYSDVGKLRLYPVQQAPIISRRSNPKIDSPDRATLRWSHPLAGLTREGFLEFREVQHHSVGAELFRRVAIGLDTEAEIFRPIVLTPVLPIGHEELLLWGQVSILCASLLPHIHSGF